MPPQGPWDPSLIQLPDGRPHLMNPYEEFMTKWSSDETYAQIMERMEAVFGSGSLPNNMIFSLPLKGDIHSKIGPLLNNERILRPFCEDLARAVWDTPKTDSKYEENLILLCSLLQRLAEITDDEEDFESSLRHITQVVGDTPEGHPMRAAVLKIFAQNGLLKFRTTYQKTHANEALQKGQRAYDISKERESPRQALVLLAMIARHRYGITDQIADLQQGAEYLHAALEAPRHKYEDEVDIYNNLGNIHRALHSRTSSETDLEQAILYGEKAVGSLPEHSIKRAAVLNNLANSLYFRFDMSHLVGDIDAAITRQEEAISCASVIDPHYPQFVQGLARLFLERFRRTNDILDLDRCIESEENAEKLNHNHDRLFLPYHHCRLGQAYKERAILTKKPRDIQKSMVVFLAGFQHESNPMTRLQCAFHVLRMIEALPRGFGYSEQLIGMVEAAQEIMSIVYHRTSSRKDTQFRLKKLSGLSSILASTLFTAKVAPLKLLESLESNRGRMISSIMESRSDALGLREKRCDLWQRYIHCRDSLGVMNSKALREDIGESYAGSIRKIEQLHEEWIEVVEEIRAVPGYERFLLLPTEKELYSLAKDGPLVSFNVSAANSAAIVITGADIQCLPLPNLKLLEAHHWVKVFASHGHSSRRDAEACDDDEETEANDRHQRSFELEPGLLYLWNAAVKPVLEHLSLLIKEDHAASLPHIFWIGGGIMGLLPLHAAGDHSPGSAQNAMSHVISCYVSTFKSLQFIRSRSSISSSNTKQEISVIAMPSTPGGYLPLKVMEEATAIGIATSNWASCNIMTQPSKKAVINALGKCTIAHFACHGSADRVEPARSALLVGKKALEKVTIEDLDAISCQNAQVVYLSACSTAEVGAIDLADEGIHLASSFQLLGFRHVIGTLWGADDHAAVEVAKNFYNALPHFNENDSLSVARALHYAITSFKNDGENWKHPSKWAPFVHFGC